MRILFHLAHPAQYHMFKYAVRNLMQAGHIIKVTINTKDILEQLLIADGVQYENILPKRRKHNTKIASLFTLFIKDFKLFVVQVKGNYDMLIGTETALSHVGWLFRKPVLIMVEDDAFLIPEAARLSFPFATHIVSPVTCNLGKWESKKISYKGFQKTAYLHPQYFTPNKEIVNQVIAKDERYFMIRVSGLSAYHDIGSKGLTEAIVHKIIGILSPLGKVLISSERELPDDLKNYLFKTKVSNIHHFLYYSDLLITDSHSMCVESAILGTPSIRFSDYAGKVGILEELENKYGLTFGIPASHQDKLMEKVQDLLKIERLKETWQTKRELMLMEKIDVTAFWTWLIDGYPESATVLRENPDFQDTFKCLYKNDK